MTRAGEPNKHHQNGAMTGRKKCYNGTIIKCRIATHDSEMTITDKASSKPVFHHGHTAKATTHTGPYCATEQWSTESGNTVYGNKAGSSSTAVQHRPQYRIKPYLGHTCSSKQSNRQGHGIDQAVQPGVCSDRAHYTSPQDNLIALTSCGNELQHGPAHAVLVADLLSSEK